ncbi:MAG: hypothetical protein J7K26_02755 [Candidatus Aenigmarchaeota archaeon]|nr:hypothetical protein [Candidatus Aenigmarchaeota archaeon]
MFTNRCPLDIDKLDLSEIKKKLIKHYKNNPEMIQKIQKIKKKSQIEKIYTNYFCIYECPVIFC